MKKTIAIFILTFFATTIFGQSSSDACQFAQTYYQGTAKAMGMGNAMGAVGGDMTAININPGSLGIYRSCEFSMTLNLSDNFNASTYYGTNANGNKIRLSIPNVNYVGTQLRSNYKAVRYTQFCIGLTRTNDFNMYTHAFGLNPTSSKIDDYLNQIDGYSVDDLSDYFAYTVYPAWSTYLVDVDNQGYYTSPVPQGGITQSFTQDFKGRTEEWTIGGSLNLMDQVFIGMTIGLPHIKRVGIRIFEESMPTNSDIQTEFNKWNFTEDINSSSFGINGKIGLIWIANRWLRLGAAFHSPSIYSFDESWQTETESQIAWITRKSLSPQSHYEYRFISPLKCLGSAAFIIGENGMVSLDAEMVNYGAARFKCTNDDYYDYSTVNQGIQDLYGRTFNFRIGTEWNVNNTYLRFGMGYYGSPYGLGQMDGSIKKASVGISLPAGEATTFDFAYELSHGKRLITLYDAGSLGIEPITQRLWRSVAIATMKVRF